MNCSEIQELLSAYHDRELTDDQRPRVSDHLGGCPECARELAGFEKLSTMVSVVTPPPPDHLWSQIEQQLGQQPNEERPIAKSVDPNRRRSFRVPSLFVLAATILAVVGTGWLTYSSWFTHTGHHQFTVEFGHYLDEFRRDPNAAQQSLLANYANQLVVPDQAITQIGYRPAVAGGLPAGYTLVSTHIIKMPCCNCVQSLCKRSDGSMLAIFEHDDKEAAEWFGNRPGITVNCNHKQCCLVQLGNQIAASWKRGKRHITLIGVRDVAEVSQMVAWLDEKKQSLPN